MIFNVVYAFAVATACWVALRIGGWVQDHAAKLTYRAIRKVIGPP